MTASLSPTASRLETLAARVTTEADNVRDRTASKNAVESLLTAKRNDLAANETLAETALKTRTLLEGLSDKKRELVRDKIENLVSYGIQAVFGPNYQFKIEQSTQRNNVAFEYKILHDFNGTTYTSDLRGYHGGGLVALVGFLLRVVMVLFVHPPRRRLILLDETMAALDGDKRANFAKLMVELGTKLNIQFLLITHSPEYQDEADAVYEIRSTGGTSTLHRI